jgi:hypothetical protein
MPAVTFNEDSYFAALIIFLLSQNTNKASNMTAIKSGFSPHSVRNFIHVPRQFSLAVCTG